MVMEKDALLASRRLKKDKNTNSGHDRQRVNRRGIVKSANHHCDAGSTLPLILFNKPFGVLCQFTDASKRITLANFLNASGYYPAGRLDRDSEGLLLLTNDGKLQQRISDPRFKCKKTYLAQVEGKADTTAIAKLLKGLELKDGMARAISARCVKSPDMLWPRDPPVRFRQHIPTSWIELSLREGRNRQVRRMTAAAGFPTLRLIRTRIGGFQVWPLAPGDFHFADADALYDDKS